MDLGRNASWMATPEPRSSDDSMGRSGRPQQVRSIGPSSSSGLLGKSVSAKGRSGGNHAGGAPSTPRDFREALAAIADRGIARRKGGWVSNTHPVL